MNKELRISLIWAAIVLPLALAAKYAERRGYIDHDTTLRIVAMNGLWIAYYGNRLPKAVAPSACARQVRRVGGWALFLSGLVYFGFWAFAPIPLAETVSTAAVAAGVIATLGYCFRLRSMAKTAKM